MGELQILHHIVNFISRIVIDVAIFISVRNYKNSDLSFLNVDCGDLAEAGTSVSIATSNM